MYYDAPETDEERARRLYQQAYASQANSTPIAPQPGMNVRGSIFSDPTMFEDPPQQGPFADLFAQAAAASSMQARPSPVPVTPTGPKNDVSAFRLPLWRFSDVGRSPGDKSGFPNLFASAPPPGWDVETNTYTKPQTVEEFRSSLPDWGRHTAESLAQEFPSAAQVELNKFRASLPDWSRHTKESLAQEFSPSPTQQPSMADAFRASLPDWSRHTAESLAQEFPTPAGPAPIQPGQSRGDWRNDNGVMINDGFSGGPAPAPAFVPGAGYATHGPNGITSNPFPTDADFGARVAMQPFTDPANQERIKQQAFRLDLERTRNDSEIARTMAMADQRNQQLQRQMSADAVRQLRDASLPATARAAAVENLNAPPEEKAMIRLDTLASEPSKDGKRLIPIGGVDKANKKVDMAKLLTTIPEDTPQDLIWKFLEQGRGIGRQDVAKRLDALYQAGTPRNPVNTMARMRGEEDYREFSPANLNDKDRQEYDMIIKLLGKRGK